MRFPVVAVWAAAAGMAACGQAQGEQKRQHVVTVVEDAPGHAGADALQKDVVMLRSGGPAGAGIFMAAEDGAFAKVVKGAPFSAETYSEFRQVLGDGNVIERKSRGASYRDSEGRTRTERTVGGGILGAAEPHSVIMIRDTVANVQWIIDPETKTATRLEIQAPRDVLPDKAAADTLFELPAPPPHAAPGMGPAPMVHMYRVRPDQMKEEKLGSQSINGVQAEGTRTTMTIPAGEIGNLQPIVTVSERWYSPQLQMVVRTKLSDPRTGEHTFELTNIRLGEPPASLFQPPAGYQVKEGKLRMEVKRSPSGEGGDNVEVRKQVQIQVRHEQ